MNGFLIIKNCSVCNHLMHKQLNFDTHEFLFISLLKHVDQDEQNGSFNIFVYYTLYT